MNKYIDWGRKASHKARNQKMHRRRVVASAIRVSKATGISTLVLKNRHGTYSYRLIEPFWYEVSK